MNALSYLPQNMNQTEGPTRSKSTLQVAGKNQEQRILESGLRALDWQRKRSSSKQTTWSAKSRSVKTWIKAGFVVATTTAIYFSLKALGYFPGSEKSGRQNSHDGAETDGGIIDRSIPRQETDVPGAIQQSQKRINRYVSRYDDINRDITLREQNNNVFEELEISDVDVPKDARHREDDILEIDTSEIKRATQHLRLLQAPVVQNPIPDQEVHVGEEFSLPLRNVFRDADGDFLSLSAKLATGDLLPTWMSCSLSPVVLGAYDTPGTARGVTVIGTTAFVTDSDLKIINVSNPVAPTLLSTYDTPGSSQEVTVIGTTAFVADWDKGLQIIDVSNPSAPSRLGYYNTLGYAYGVTVIGTMAFVANGENGLQIINVSNPSAPILLGTYDTPGYAIDVTVIGTMAFVADGESGLQIIDVSTPGAPALLGTINTLGYAGHVTVINTTAFVANGENGLQIIDVSNPRVPTLLSSYDIPGHVYDFTVTGTTAFVTNWGDDLYGLQIINVSNPRAPALLCTYDTPGSAIDVTVIGTMAFVADGESGLQIIDIGGNWSLSGTAASSDLGVLSIKVMAEDGFGGIAEDIFSLTVSPFVSPISSSKWSYVGPLIGIGGLLLSMGGYCYYRKRGHQPTPKENKLHGNPITPNLKDIPPPPYEEEAQEEPIPYSKPVEPIQHRSSISMEVMPDSDIHVDLPPANMEILSDGSDSFSTLLSTIRDLENANQTLTDATRKLLYQEVKLYIHNNFGEENLLIQRLIEDPMATLEKLNQDEKFKSQIKVSSIRKWVINCLAKLKEDFLPFYLDASERRCLSRLSEG